MGGRAGTMPEREWKRLFVTGTDVEEAARQAQLYRQHERSEAKTMTDTTIHVFEDREHAGDWRVEYVDDDGGCYVTIFSGPMAQARARAYGNALTNKILVTLRAG